MKTHFLSLTCYHQKPHEPKNSSCLVSSCDFWFSQPLPPDSWKDSRVLCSYICSFLASISIKQLLLMSKLDQSSSVLFFSLCLALLWQQRLQNLCRAPLMSRGCNWGFRVVPTQTSTCSTIYSNLLTSCIRALQHLILKNKFPPLSPWHDKIELTF